MDSKKELRRFTLLLFATYFAAYFNRISLGAVIVDMTARTAFTNAQLSLALTVNFITYGVVQLLSGYLGDRLQPRTLILSGLLMTALMNLSVPFAPSPAVLCVIWCVNGFAQSLFWPPITRLLVNCVPQKNYESALMKVCWGANGGSIAVFLFAAFFAAVLDFRAMFVTAAALALIMFYFVFRCCPLLPAGPGSAGAADNAPDRTAEDTAARSAQAPARAAVPMRTVVTPFFLITMFTILLHGSLKEGISSWMPTFISENFTLSNSLSILSGVMMPVLAIVYLKFSETVFRAFREDLMRSTALFFSISAASAVLLSVFNGKNAILSVIFAALVCASMHGVNLMLVCTLPSYYKKTGHVSLVSGILNAATYIGTASATYGIPYFSSRFGWKTMIAIWFATALSGAVLCIVLAPRARVLRDEAGA